jgi:hypothetical protein
MGKRKDRSDALDGKAQTLREVGVEEWIEGSGSDAPDKDREYESDDEAAARVDFLFRGRGMGAGELQTERGQNRQ